LLTVREGKYVVRCLVQLEGTTRSTGLAAAETVEQAEDRARIRAIEALGLDGGSPPPPPLPGDRAIDPVPDPEPVPDRGTPMPTLEASDAASEPIDHSDVINRTTIELRRLRWTTEQGRIHLEQTYQKRSRQHLTDEELVDFLHYLEAQPTPGAGDGKMGG
jgi:hypothetical protein